MGHFDRPSGGGDAAPCCQGQREKGSQYPRDECADAIATGPLRLTGINLPAFWIRFCYAQWAMYLRTGLRLCVLIFNRAIVDPGYKLPGLE